MSELDYYDVCRSIQSDKPEEYRVNSITVNFDLMDIDIEPRIRQRALDTLQTKAQSMLNDEVTTMESNSLSELWSYDIVHECGSTPMYDSHNEEWYCSSCEKEEEEKGIMDY